MSYCAVCVFRDGKYADERRWSNSWGGAPMIWSALFDRYLRDEMKPHEYMLSRPDDMWALADNPILLDAERACLLMTFDWAVIRREHFARAAADLREFAKWHSRPGRACHLAEWADFIEACDGEAVGFYHTSVASHPWRRYDEAMDAMIAISVDEAQTDVYERVNEHAH